MQAFEAWSQNLGHERMLTTLTCYGTVWRQPAELILNIKSGMGSAGRIASSVNPAPCRADGSWDEEYSRCTASLKDRQQ
jgi:hypothetical protein